MKVNSRIKVKCIMGVNYSIRVKFIIDVTCKIYIKNKMYNLKMNFRIKKN
jgi:hypothetical protein